VLCPVCQRDSKVKETRREGMSTKRYRECSARHRFSTSEVLSTSSLQVRKRSGAVVPFDRVALTESIRKAAVLDIPAPDMRDLVDRVIQLLFDGEQSEPVISTTVIGNAVLEALRADRNHRVVFARYGLLFASAGDRPRVTDAASFAAWLVDERLIPMVPEVGRLPRSVLKRRNGDLEDYDPEKLRRSIRFAAKKRPNEGSTDSERVVEFAEKVAQQVENAVRYQSTVTAGQLATEVMHAIKSSGKPMSSGERELALLRVASTAKKFTEPIELAREAVGLDLARQEKPEGPRRT
jgi:transcriptional regulator NrdR family protein